MRPGLLAAVLAIACGAGLQPCVEGAGRAGSPGQPARSGWSTVTVPMERAAFAALVGLDAALPRTLLLYQAIRRLHDADAASPDLRARVVAGLRAPGAGTTEVPLPLDAETWCRLVADPCTPATLAASLLSAPRTGFSYIGLANLDAPTRAFVTSSPRLLRWLTRERPGTLAAFGDAIRVRGGHVLVPGGPGAERAWTEVVGASPSEPEAFIRRVLAAGAGRLAYFYDTVSHLAPAAQRFALGPTPGSARAMADHFGAIPASWDVELRPFVRPPVDPASLLLRVAVGADGRLVGPASKAFWSLALDPDGVSAGAGALAAAEEVDAAWLVGRVVGEDSRRRLARLQALLYVQRHARALAEAGPVDAVEVSRAVIRMPALVLVLERAGISDPALLASLVRCARALTGIVSAADRPVVLAEWQSAVALVARLCGNGTLDEARARALLASLASMEPDGGRLGDRVARWLRDDLLPAVSGASSGPATTQAEETLLDALAGTRDAAQVVLEWEGTSYVLDRASAERARLDEVRVRQDATALDDALEAFDIADALRDGSDAASLATRVDALAARLPARAPAGSGAGETTRALARLVRPAAAGATGQRTAAAEAEPLAAAAERLLAETLTGIVYACALGASDDRLFLGGDVSARHEFGAERPGMPPGASPPWAMPTEQASAGRPWHVQGSLLGLDLSLGRLRLRRLLGTMPAHQSRVNASERSALAMSMLLTPALVGGQDAGTMVDAMTRGRTRVRGADGEERRAVCQDAGLCGWRSEIVDWAREHEPEAALASVTRAELAWAGHDPVRPLPDAWGTAPVVEGLLAVRFPPAVPIESVAGRPTLAHGLSAFADLKLRLAEWLVSRGLPASIVRELGAAALQDFLDEVRPAYPDDWLAFAMHADRLPSARIDDYLSALTVPGGPLVPVEGREAAR